MEHIHVVAPTYNVIAVVVSVFYVGTTLYFISLDILYVLSLTLDTSRNTSTFYENSSSSMLYEERVYT